MVNLFQDKTKNESPNSMRELLFILMIVIPTVSNGQNDDLEILLKKKRYYSWNDSYDSLLIVCYQIKSISRKTAKDENVDYYIAEAYLGIKHDDAVKYSKRYLRKPVTIKPRERNQKKSYKRYLSGSLYEYYKEQGDNKKALKYLKKYFYFMSGTHIKWHRVNLYEKIIDCYTELNDHRHIEIYKKKIEELKN